MENFKRPFYSHDQPKFSSPHMFLVALLLIRNKPEGCVSGVSYFSSIRNPINGSLFSLQKQYPQSGGSKIPINQQLEATTSFCPEYTGTYKLFIERPYHMKCEHTMEWTVDERKMKSIYWVGPLQGGQCVDIDLKMDYHGECSVYYHVDLYNSEDGSNARTQSSYYICPTPTPRPQFTEEGFFRGDYVSEEFIRNMIWGW